MALADNSKLNIPDTRSAVLRNSRAGESSSGAHLPLILYPLASLALGGGVALLLSGIVDVIVHVVT
jgi:uncharacterized PurR-regulated membrane protein YhhQ (DUF165 family)